MATIVNKPVTEVQGDKKPVDMGRWMNNYKKREDINAHSENTVHLAKLVGTPEHHEEALRILLRHERVGHIEPGQYEKRSKIDKELWPKAVAMHEAWKASKGK